jgi:hypothetical protein
MAMDASPSGAVGVAGAAGVAGKATVRCETRTVAGKATASCETRMVAVGWFTVTPVLGWTTWFTMMAYFLLHMKQMQKQMQMTRTIGSTIMRINDTPMNVPTA